MQVVYSLCFEMKTGLLLLISLIAAGSTFFSMGSANAQSDEIIVTTAEGVGSFNTSLSGTSVENFNNLSIGDNYNVKWSDVGTIDQVSILNANEYGGAPYDNGTGASPYAVQSASGSLGGIQTTTLSLNNSSSYFGLYWSAGDANNSISFYNGNTLVGSFSTASLMDKLPSSYNGNPNYAGTFGGQDPNEPFGFINFYAGAGTEWNKVVLSDTASSGFESDNWTSRINGWNPSVDGTLGGTPVVLLQNDNGNLTTTDITSVSTVNNEVSVATASGSVNFVPSAPGAPAPPLLACLAFAGVLLLQAMRRVRSTV